jgi:hypothetical protein
MYLSLSQISSELSFFPLHTPKSGHNCVTVQQVELQLQGIIFTHPFGMHKEYKHKIQNGNSSVGRAHLTCGMETAQW